MSRSTVKSVGWANLVAAIALSLLFSTRAIANSSQPLSSVPTLAPDLASTLAHNSPEQNQEIEQPSDQQSDYGLLIRAIHQYLGRDHLSMESELTMNIAAPGAQAQIMAQVKTLAAGPRQFRTSIDFIDPQASLDQKAEEPLTHKKLLLVCDGNQVWIYNPNLNLYSITPYSQFEASDDNFVTGMILRLIASFRQGAGEPTVAAWAAMPVDNLIQLIEAGIPSQPFGLTRNSKTLGQSRYTTYTYADLKQELTMVAYINPLTAEIEHFHLQSSKQQSQVRLEERVTHQEELATIPVQTFEFTPPPGAKLSKSRLSLDPF
ncbi:MAG: hypothetical protein HC934_09805 [Acaryochloridaceae cyanobacterium SU_2_1]|nr:hypothetical protein [Acaryochloridaceae cyanobacterium SU_2_1]